MAYRGGGPRQQQRRGTNEPRVNRRIRVPQVRVIVAEGNEQLGILNTEDAFRRAQDMGLDLVEVQPHQRPPVCKIMDYGQYKYEQKKRSRENKKSQKQIELKEVKFRPKTDTHDFDVKVNRLRRFLEEGNKGKVTIMFRGREIVHPEIGRDILKRVAETVSDLAAIESHPRMEGRQMFMIVGPHKKGVPKPAAASNTAAPKPAAPAPEAEARPAEPQITRAPQRPKPTA
ncbi:MAG: translation initiation factor IF-3 [Deltaproteobacteria bacterium]|nr:translation initiation factor IF-3 [Deltaproteobacteria bacterium]